MTVRFRDLMMGLEDVRAFLGGKTAGYKVNVPTDTNIKNSHDLPKTMQETVAKTSKVRESSKI